MVIGLDASKDFLSLCPDLEGCLIYDDGGEFKIWTSAGFSVEK
jgi:hypothetical protein